MASGNDSNGWAEQWLDSALRCCAGWWGDCLQKVLNQKATVSDTREGSGYSEREEKGVAPASAEICSQSDIRKMFEDALISSMRTMIEQGSLSTNASGVNYITVATGSAPRVLLHRALEKAGLDPSAPIFPPSTRALLFETGDIFVPEKTGDVSHRYVRLDYPELPADPPFIAAEEIRFAGALRFREEKRCVAAPVKKGEKVILPGPDAGALERFLNKFNGHIVDGDKYLVVEEHDAEPGYFDALTSDALYDLINHAEVNKASLVDNIEVGWKKIDDKGRYSKLSEVFQVMVAEESFRTGDPYHFTIVNEGDLITRDENGRIKRISKAEIEMNPRWLEVDENGNPTGEIYNFSRPIGPQKIGASVPSL